MAQTATQILEATNITRRNLLETAPNPVEQQRELSQDLPIQPAELLAVNLSNIKRKRGRRNLNKPHT